MLYWDSFKTDF